MLLNFKRLLYIIFYCAPALNHFLEWVSKESRRQAGRGESSSLRPRQVCCIARKALRAPLSAEGETITWTQPKRGVSGFLPGLKGTEAKLSAEGGTWGACGVTALMWVWASKGAGQLPYWWWNKVYQLSHGPDSFHNIITWNCSFPRCWVCVCADEQMFLPTVWSAVCNFTPGNKLPLWLGAISHWNNDICHDFHASSCPGSYLQTVCKTNT